MKNSLLFLTVAAFSAVAIGAPPTQTAPKPQKPPAATSAKIKRVNFLPVPCKRRDCWAQGQDAEEHAIPKPEEISHGNIQLEFTDGSKKQITQQSAAVGNADDIGFDTPSNANPKLSPDGQTVGWTQGTHQPCTDWSIGGTMFVNSDLVLYRNGKILRTLKVPGTFINGWRFWNNGKQVAIGSRWHHGMGYVRLFDVDTGRLIEKHSTPEAREKKLKWAQDLTP